MEIIIYEDQTGEMQFPEKRQEKDSKIVSFFNNNIDLYIEKIGDSLTIYCHLIAFKASTRPTGYYIVYKDIYGDSIFTNFKKEIDKILKGLEFQPKTGHQDNIIFENIVKFDDRFQYYKEDTDIVIEAIKYGRNLEYSAGDIKEISAFCKDILKITNSIKISVSSTKNNLGNINILINKKHSESLKRTDSTEQIISEQRERLREKKKAEDGAPGLIKIKEAFDGVREGVDILKSAGYNNLEIRNEIERKKDELFMRFPTYISREREPKKIETGIPTVTTEKLKDEEYEDVEIDKNTTKSHIKLMITIVGIVTVVAAIIVIVAYPNILPESVKDMIIKPTPTPIVPEPDTSPEPTVTSGKARTQETPSGSALVDTNESGTTPISIMYKGDPGNLKITNYDPTTVVSSVVEIPIKFNITTNQLANITWYINNIRVQFNESVYSATYTNTSLSSGTWTVNATAIGINGTDSKQWEWIVTNK